MLLALCVQSPAKTPRLEEDETGRQDEALTLITFLHIFPLLRFQNGSIVLRATLHIGNTDKCCPLKAHMHTETPSHRLKYFSIYSYECECLQLYFLLCFMTQSRLRNHFTGISFDPWDEAASCSSWCQGQNCCCFCSRRNEVLRRLSFFLIPVPKLRRCLVRGSGLFAEVCWVFYEPFELLLGLWLAGEWKTPFPYRLASSVEESRWGNRLLEAVQFNFWSMCAGK